MADVPVLSRDAAAGVLELWVLMALLGNRGDLSHSGGVVAPGPATHVGTPGDGSLAAPATAAASVAAPAPAPTAADAGSEGAVAGAGTGVGVGGSTAVAAALADMRACLLVDNVAAAAAALAALGPGSTVAYVLDNAGLELVCDLGCIDALLRVTGAAVEVHAKDAPVFVSDATPQVRAWHFVHARVLPGRTLTVVHAVRVISCCQGGSLGVCVRREQDVADTLAWLASGVGPTGGAPLAARLNAALASGVLTVISHAAYTR